MAREAYDQRRSAILDAAQGLFLTRGYEKASVQQIIDVCGIAKGTFYHYFRTKSELLDAIVDRFTDGLVSELDPIANDRSLLPLERLNSLFRESGMLKSQTANLAVIKSTLVVFWSDENILIRHKMLRRSLDMAVALISPVVRDGVNSGVFRITGEPEAITRLLVQLGHSSIEPFMEYMLAGDYPAAIDSVEEMMKVWQSTADRILGLPDGSCNFIEDAVMERFRKGLVEL